VRSEPGDVPGTQRASKGGLIISEARPVSLRGYGYAGAPGIYADRHIGGWRRVTDAVHRKGGRMFLQLWHVGRQSHTGLQPNGEAPVAPSAIRAEGDADSVNGRLPFTPRLKKKACNKAGHALTLAASLAATFTASLALPVASAIAAACEDRITAELRQISVPPEDVKSMKVDLRRGGGRAFTNYRVNGWLRMHSCTGYAVVTLTHNCFVPRSYTTGDCRIDGIPQY
jgi:hypothetical protein